MSTGPRPGLFQDHQKARIQRSLLLIALLLILSACGSSTTSHIQTRPASPTPATNQGQQLLATVAGHLNTAKTLHAIFDTTLNGQLLAGNMSTEVWNASPAKNRTAILQSTLSQFPAGSLTITNGKQIWQYDPLKKIVYTGQLPQTATGTSTGRLPFAVGGTQSQSILRLVQSILTRSDATLVSSSTNINRRAAYDVHVVPQGQLHLTGSENFNYEGEVYIDKATQLPLQIDLTVPAFGQVILNVNQLLLNVPISNNLFNFVPPAGVKVLPLQQQSATSDTGSITLAAAEQQAGYHLLSIPSSQASYVLQGVDALGAPGNQIYTLNYTYGNLSFTISEGKPLANLPTSGQSINLRGTTATFSTSNGSSTLAWTEKGIGIQIMGNLSKDQLVEIAHLLT